MEGSHARRAFNASRDLRDFAALHAVVYHALAEHIWTGLQEISNIVRLFKRLGKAKAPMASKERVPGAINMILVFLVSTASNLVV
jgi:hypothetical protein